MSQAAFDRLLTAMLQDGPQARLAAADAAEKASRVQPGLLTANKTSLLGVHLQAEQAGLRWHLLQMLPRLQLDDGERRRVFETAGQWMDGGSRIVAAEALTAMFALSTAGEDMRDQAAETAHRLLASPSPALRARARRMLAGPGCRPGNARGR